MRGWLSGGKDPCKPQGSTTGEKLVEKRKGKGKGQRISRQGARGGGTNPPPKTRRKKKGGGKVAGVGKERGNSVNTRRGSRWETVGWV